MANQEESAYMITGSYLQEFISMTIREATPKINANVDLLRLKHPETKDLDLANFVVKKEAMKNGLAGSLFSAGGILSLPVTLPASYIVTLRIQIYTTMTVAFIFGRTEKTSDLESDLSLLLFGNGLKEGLKNGLIKTSITIGKNAFKGASKIIPLIGVPIGFGVEYLAARSVGVLAIKYYNS